MGPPVPITARMHSTPQRGEGRGYIPTGLTNRMREEGIYLQGRPIRRVLPSVEVLRPYLVLGVLGVGNLLRRRSPRAPEPLEVAFVPSVASEQSRGNVRTFPKNVRTFPKNVRNVP
eukprot:809534-Pyramimonas_sp.AAC.1